MMAAQALGCLEMMDFDHKDTVMQIIARNAMMAPMGMPGMAPMGGMMPGAVPVASANEQLGGEKPSGESAVTKNARQRVAESSSPT